MQEIAADTITRELNEQLLRLVRLQSVATHIACCDADIADDGRCSGALLLTIVLPDHAAVLRIHAGQFARLRDEPRAFVRIPNGDRGRFVAVPVGIRRGLRAGPQLLAGGRVEALEHTALFARIIDARVEVFPAAGHDHEDAIDNRRRSVDSVASCAVGFFVQKVGLVGHRVALAGQTDARGLPHLLAGPGVQAIHAIGADCEDLAAAHIRRAATAAVWATGVAGLPQRLASVRVEAENLVGGGGLIMHIQVNLAPGHHRAAVVRERAAFFRPSHDLLLALPCQHRALRTPRISELRAVRRDTVAIGPTPLVPIRFPGNRRRLFGAAHGGTPGGGKCDNSDDGEFGGGKRRHGPKSNCLRQGGE